MAVFLVKSFVKHTPIEVSRVCSIPILSNSISNRHYLSTHISHDEILNQILDATNTVDPPASREEICTSSIRKLCDSGNLLVAANLPRTLRVKQIFLGPHAYNYILEAAARKHDIYLLSYVFKDLLVSWGAIGLNSFLIVARAFGRHNDNAVLLGFISEVSEMGLPRIDIVLNRFIFALAKCGHVDHALLVFDHMKGLKCKPDLVTYNTVLAILGRLGRIDEMLNEFACMKRNDGIIPDIFTYNTVLNSLRKRGRLDLCLMHFDEMCERGIQPDLLTFKDVIESLGRSGNIDRALNFFDEMKRKVRPSVHVYRALVFSLKKMGKMELASKFSTEMNKLFPDSVLPRDFRYINR